MPGFALSTKLRLQSAEMEDAMSRKINVTLTQTCHEQPVIIVDPPLCGDKAEKTPGELRHLAAMLLMIADEAEEHSSGQPDVKHSYSI